MSVRRFNYTKRQKIARRDVTISLRRLDGDLRFDAQMSLSDYSFPGEGRVFLEASRGIERLRFDWGTVQAPTPPEDRSLALFSSEDGLSFRLVVREEGTPSREGLILGEASNVRPELTPGDATGGRSLLPVVIDSGLGQRLWRIDFAANGPVLQVNPSLGGKEWCATAEFRSAVLPACVREVLLQVVLSEKPEWPVATPDDQNWASLWLWFAHDLPGVPTLPDERDSYEQIVEWLDAAIAAFCRSGHLMDRWRESRMEEDQ